MDTFLRLHAEPSSPSSWLSHMPANCPNPTRHPQLCNVNFNFFFFISADAHDRSIFQFDTSIHIYKLSKGSRLKTSFQDIRLCNSCKVCLSPLKGGPGRRYLHLLGMTTRMQKIQQTVHAPNYLKNDLHSRSQLFIVNCIYN